MLLLAKEVPVKISATGALAKSVLQKVVSNVLPERLPVAETNSTRGLWQMALNLMLGNPKEQNGRK
ncbi:hypothetical protein SK128_022370, partial [Halocaridina rubra]